MPLYEYKCQECGSAFSIKATVTEYENGLDTNCPLCSSSKVKRLLSGVALFNSKPVESEVATSSGHSCGCGGHCSH